MCPPWLEYMDLGTRSSLVEEVGLHYLSDPLGKFVLSVPAVLDYVLLEILIPREGMLSPGNKAGSH